MNQVTKGQLPKLSFWQNNKTAATGKIFNAQLNGFRNNWSGKMHDFLPSKGQKYF